jgi:uncharacterized protein involved in exopolysaccharide biosynthesis
VNEFYASNSGEDGAAGSVLAQLPTILWERRWWVIGPTVVTLVAALAALLMIPPVYRSTAVMLVESSQLPDAVVQASKGEQVERRIARIREQVTSRPALLKIIEQHGLYAKERRSEPLSDVIATMREAIAITPQLSGEKDDNAIAFELSVDYYEAAPAQAVAQDLMDNILKLDYSGNLEQATGTAQFLNDQATGLEQKIGVLQGQISAIKARNGMVLGSQGMVLGNDATSYDLQIAALQRDNSSLLAQKAMARDSDDRSPVVVQAEAALAGARAVYSETHPDVILAKQRLAEARELAKQNVGKIPFEGIDQQIANNNAQMGALRAAKDRAQAQVNTQLSAQARAPLVQQEIAELEQQLSVLNTQYSAVQDQLLAARTGVRAEDEQMSERLAVVDPPVVPDSPTSPNRILIAAIGLVGGLGLGIILALGVELFLRPIRDPKTLQGVTGAPPLAVIPIIQAAVQRQPRWRRWIPWRRQPVRG